MEDYNEINSSLNNVEKSMSNVNNSLTVLTKQTNQFALSIKNLSVQCINLNKQIVSINLSAMNKLSNSMQSLSQISLSNTNGQLVSLNNHLFSISKYGPISFQIDVHIEGINQITDIISQISTNINGLTGSFSTVWQEITIGKETLVEIGYTLEDVYLKMQTTSTSAKDLSKSVNMSSSTESMNLFSAATSSFDLVWGTFKKGLDITSEISKTGSSINSLYKGLTDLSTHGGMLSGVFSGLANAVGLLANPVVAVGVGIGALALGTIYFYTQNNLSNASLEKELKLLKNKKEALEETAKSLNESNNQAKIIAENAIVPYDKVSMYVQKLKDMTGEDGLVSEIKKAQYYVESINSILPNSVQLTEAGNIVWLKNAEAIKENIDLLKQKATIEAYEEDYIASMRQRTQLQAELTSAQNAYNVESEKCHVLKKQLYDDLLNEGKEQSKYTAALHDSELKLNARKEILDATKEMWAANQESIQNYETQINALDGTTETFIAKVLEEYGVWENEHSYTIDSLATGLIDLDDKLNESGIRYQEMTTFEIEASKVAREQILNDLIEKSTAFGYSYDEMINTLSEKGVFLNDLESRQLRNGVKKAQEEWRNKEIEQIKSNNSSLLENEVYGNLLLRQTGLNLESYVALFKENGNNAGLGLMVDLAAALQENGGEVDDNVKTILYKIGKQVDTFDPTAEIDVETNQPALDSAVEAISNSFGNMRFGITSTVKTLGERLVGSLNIEKYAVGGFPQIGEMFIARESGPELVGRINGKTAVANNDQIVAGIEGGVYSGVAKAMAAFGNNNGSKTITIISQIDGKVVAKSVYDEHNRQVIQTGQSPLLI